MTPIVPPSVRTLRLALLAGIIGAGLLPSACAEAPFERTNPIDPESEYAIEIVHEGDTIDGTAVAFDLALRGTPAIHRRFNDAIRWSTDLTGIRHVGGASFITDATLQPSRVTVVARLGPHLASRAFVVRQRAGSWTLSCIASNPCTPVPAPGVQFVINVEGTTTDGQPALGVRYAIANASLEVRDPSIAGIVAKPTTSGPRITMVGLATGSTWVVFSFDGATDSLLVTVD